jgi:hypothetical protein
MDSKFSQGIAATAALANGTPCIPGATLVGMSAANYNGASGIGLTVSYWSKSGLINFNAGVANGGSMESTVVRGGFAIVFK